MTEYAFEHEQAAALLPWLANGTLDGAERERVERHVRQCLPCRAELGEQIRLKTLVRRQPVVHLSADAGFERLRSRLEYPAPRSVSEPGKRLFALAAAVGIAGVGWTIAAGLLDNERASDAGEYRTLSDAPTDGSLIDVIFAEGVRESEMRVLLEELDAEIVAGPSRGLGRYTLRVPTSNGTPAALDAVVRRLLDDERVRFAGPTFSPPAAEPDARNGASGPGRSTPHDASVSIEGNP